MAAQQDLYAVLEVARGASANEIRKAFRKLARKYHPDVNQGKKDTEERFKRVSAAYEVLGNADSRALYDEFGDESLRSGFDPEVARRIRRAGQPRPGTNPFSGFGGFGSDVGGGFAFDSDDLLSQVFGATPGRKVRRKSPRRAVVEIDLAQAIAGSQVALQWTGHRPCAACSGTGGTDGAIPVTCTVCKGAGRSEAGDRVRMLSTCAACGGTGRARTACSHCGGAGQVQAAETLNVRIPPGADNGSRLRVPHRDGDITIETHVRPHPYFRREGLDLYLRLPVTLDEAYNGGKVRVPTPGGVVDMTVPARTQNGKRLRIKGKGIAKGGRVGDLYLEVDVRLPESDDPTLADAVRKAAGAYTRDVRADVKL